MDLATAKHKDFYYRQIEFLANKDVEGLIANQYNDDADLLSFTNHIVGAPALVTYFKGYIAQLGYIKLLSTDQYTETDDAMFFEAAVETAGGIANVYDVFTLRDGKISHHFTGLRSFIPKAQS
jgi:hypothetical protein